MRKAAPMAITERAPRLINSHTVIAADMLRGIRMTCNPLSWSFQHKTYKDYYQIIRENDENSAFFIYFSRYGREPERSSPFYVRFDENYAIEVRNQVLITLREKTGENEYGEFIDFGPGFDPERTVYDILIPAREHHPSLQVLRYCAGFAYVNCFPGGKFQITSAEDIVSYAARADETLCQTLGCVSVADRFYAYLIENREIEPVSVDTEKCLPWIKAG